MLSTAYTHFDLNGIHYTVAPRTFFQAHWSLNKKLVDFVLQELMPLRGKQVLDLYAGAGNFSLPLAVHAEQVVAVEENPFAVDDGNTEYRTEQPEKLQICQAAAEKYKIKKRFDLLILDPPRLGLTSDMTNKILENPADTIIYISCNPSTLARDLKKTQGYIHHTDSAPDRFFPEHLSYRNNRLPADQIKISDFLQEKKSGWIWYFNEIENFI